MLITNEKYTQWLQYFFLATLAPDKKEKENKPCFTSELPSLFLYTFNSLTIITWQVG